MLFWCNCNRIEFSFSIFSLFFYFIVLVLWMFLIQFLFHFNISSMQFSIFCQFYFDLIVIELNCLNRMPPKMKSSASTAPFHRLVAVTFSSRSFSIVSRTGCLFFLSLILPILLHLAILFLFPALYNRYTAS